MAGLIRSFDWTSTPLGPIEAWPQSLKTATGLLITSPVPIVMLWGPLGIMIYNDAYSVFAGRRHPELLGSEVRKGWPEVADFNDNIMKVGLAGGTLSYRDQELLLDRSGKLEPAWLNLDYSPVPDESGRPAGVIAIVVEITEKVLADRRAAAEHVRQRNLLSQMPGFVGILTGPDHVFEYVNDAYIAIAGARDYPGRPVREVFPDLEGQGFFELLDQVYASGQRYTARGLPLRLTGEDEELFIDLLYEPIRDEQGAVEGIFVGGYDATEAYRGAAALRDSEARLRLVIEAAQDHAIFTTDAQGAITSWSAGAEAIFGWPAAEILGQSGSVLFTPEDRARGADLRELTTAAADGYSNDERWHIRRDGGRVFMNGSVHPLPPGPDGKALGFLKIARDETNRRRTEAKRDALARLTDKFRGLQSAMDIEFAAAEILGETLGASRVGYGTIDPEAETLHVDRDWNAPGVETLAGVVPLRAYGSFIDSLKRNEFIAIADVREDPRTAEAAQALEHRSARSFVNIPIVEHGKLVAVLYVNHAQIVDWSQDDLAFIQEAAERTRTTAQRARGEVALREANETLEANVEARTRDLMQAQEALRQSQKMEAVGQLTGGIAHDFNNLLAGISGSLELLDKRIREGQLSGADRYIGAAQAAARRAAALTQRLLAFSRRQTLDPKPTDLNRLIAGMEDLIRRSVGPTVEVEVVGAGGLWTTRIDPSQLENALLNLCINGRDAMAPDGGRLTIETANKWLDERAAKDRELPPGQYVSLCVTDTGSGMPPDVMTQAFDPFFTTKPLGQGTGLGLSMIHGFVRQSGGQVRLYSEVGHGTTACLYLPRFTGALDAPDTTEAAPEPDAGHGETVLIIDDEPIVRMLVVEVLEEAGYRAIEADDGPSGLEILQSDARIDLLITDVGLPGGMNGRQVADAARTTRPELKVLFITGYAENAAVGNGHLDAGMQVITKPFAMAVLANKIREMIEG